MSTIAERFEAYLDAEESVEYTADGTLLDEGDRLTGSIGVTDRRVLFAAPNAEYIEIDHNFVYSIRSRPRSSYTTRGIGYRLTAVAGILVAALAFGGIVVASGGALPVVFSVVAVAGLGLAGYAWSADADVAWTDVEDALGGIGNGWSDRAAAWPSVPIPPLDGDGVQFLTVWFGLVGLVALVGVSVLAGLAATILAVGTTLGVALGHFGLERTRTLNRLGQSRRREREIAVYLVDGRTVRFRVDRDDDLTRELSRRSNNRATGPFGIQSAEG